MKRVIKFRFWNKIKETWANQGSAEWSCEHGEGAFFPYYDSEDIEVSQYTGLKDINDVEIYEDDIIEFKREYRCAMYGKDLENFEVTTIKSVVFFQKGSFFVRYDIPLNDLPKQFNNGDNINARWEENYYDFKVIGNKYSTPNLIK